MTMHTAGHDTEPLPESPVEFSQEQDRFAISLQPGKSFDLLVLTGQIDMSAAPYLHQEAIQVAAGLRPVQIDWSRAEQVCPSAVQVLLALAAVLSGHGQTLEVRADNPRVRAFLEIAGLSGHFPRVKAAF